MFSILNIIGWVSRTEPGSRLTFYRTIGTIETIHLQLAKRLPMKTIEVDFDVFKALTLRRPSEEVTENDVLRELLGLPARHQSTAPDAGAAASDWVTKGVRFPAGTEFRASYKGQIYLARVEGGALVLDGERYDSPSAAAMSITGSPVNGWTFWECRLPGRATWQSIKALRRAA